MHPTERPRYRRLPAAALGAGLLLGACADEPAGPYDGPVFGRVTGAVVAPGVSTFGSLTARVRWDGVEVTGRVQSNGSFSLAMPDRVEGLGFLTIEPAEGEGLHPAWMILSPASLDVEQTLVLAPTRWTIQTGDYAGRTVPIDPALAADPSVQPSYWGFYFPFGQEGFEQRLLTGTEWLAELRTWRERAHPIPIAFDRAGTAARIAPADSVAFWSHVDRMERALGWDVFRPARVDEHTLLAEPRRLEGGILVRIDDELAMHGLGITSPPGRSLWRLTGEAGSWSGGMVDYVSFSSGDIDYGHVVVDAPARLAEGRLVIHELMHTLGAGHGCAWRSVQTYCAGLSADVPTAEDVAHLQVLRRMRALERTHETSWGVLAAVFGRRVVSLGLPPVPSPEGLQGERAVAGR